MQNQLKFDNFIVDPDEEDNVRIKTSNNANWDKLKSLLQNQLCNMTNTDQQYAINAIAEGIATIFAFAKKRVTQASWEKDAADHSLLNKVLNLNEHRKQSLADDLDVTKEQLIIAIKKQVDDQPIGPSTQGEFALIVRVFLFDIFKDFGITINTNRKNSSNKLARFILSEFIGVNLDINKVIDNAKKVPKPIFPPVS